MKKGKIVIGLDLDGVIIDHTKTKLYLAAKLGWELKPEQTPSEVIKKIIPPLPLRKLKRSLYDDPKIAFLSPLMPDVKAMLTKIKEMKVFYVLISRRQRPTTAIALLELRGLWPRFFNMRNTFFVQEDKDKNIKAARLGVTHYVDDKVEVLETLIDVKNKFLFDKFNIFKGIDSYIRIKSWPELIKNFQQNDLKFKN